MSGDEPSFVDGLDLPNIAFGARTTLTYSESGADTGGTRTVTDGRHAAAIALLGNYMAESFTISRFVTDILAASALRRLQRRFSNGVTTDATPFQSSGK